MTFRRAPSGRIKPPHVVGVNWGNPISQGLKHQQTYADKGGFDPASGKVYAWVTPTDVSLQAGKKWGTGAVTSTGSTRQQYTATRLPANVDTTFRWLFQAGANGTLQALLRSSGGPSWYIQAAGTIAYYNGAAFQGVSATTLVAGTVYDVVARHVGATLVSDLFINGVVDTLSLSHNNNEIVNTSFDIWGDAFVQIVKGPKFLFQAWQRPLQNTEIIALYRDPFQLSMINIPRRRVAVRADAAAGGFHARYNYDMTGTGIHV